MDYPPEFFQALADPAAGRYEPDARGLLSARQAVAEIFSKKGALVDPERIFLTASTSEAYAYLFRLLADPGESILVPRPSYPLFEYLADLSDVQPVSYPLLLDPLEGWRIDFEALETLAAQGAKALVVVHPNHPTGSGIRQRQLQRLIQLCQRTSMALISDEVFAEYFFSFPADLPLTLSGEHGILLFVLGGLSKFLGLPQMKLSWAGCFGPARLVEPALDRLELIADSYLSVNTPVQVALPKWVASPAFIQKQIQNRLKMNLRRLSRIDPANGWRLLPAEGGWNAVLRNDALRSWQAEQDWVLTLLDKSQVLVYPGSFFDFDKPGHAVISLLTRPEPFSRGMERLQSTR